MKVGQLFGALALGLTMLVPGGAPVHAQSSQRECPSFRFQIMSEGPWPAYGQIPAGETCTGRRWRIGGNAVFKRLYLAVPPERGKVRLQEGGRYFYTAPTNFTGVDRFTLRVCGALGSTDSCTNIAFHMTVQPASR